jgi:hypothetical protein
MFILFSFFTQIWNQKVDCVIITSAHYEPGEYRKSERTVYRQELLHNGSGYTDQSIFHFPATVSSMPDRFTIRIVPVRQNFANHLDIDDLREENHYVAMLSTIRNDSPNLYESFPGRLLANPYIRWSRMLGKEYLGSKIVDTLRYKADCVFFRPKVSDRGPNSVRLFTQCKKYWFDVDIDFFSRISDLPLEGFLAGSAGNNIGGVEFVLPTADMPLIRGLIHLIYEQNMYSFISLKVFGNLGSNDDDGNTGIEFDSDIFWGFFEIIDCLLMIKYKNIMLAILYAELDNLNLNERGWIKLFSFVIRYNIESIIRRILPIITVIYNENIRLVLDDEYWQIMLRSEEPFVLLVMSLNRNELGFFNNYSRRLRLDLDDNAKSNTQWVPSTGGGGEEPKTESGLDPEWVRRWRAGPNDEDGEWVTDEDHQEDDQQPGTSK